MPKQKFRSRPYNSQGGFTLIEIMIVVLIISILASLAYPSYKKYVERTKRVEAQSQMLEFAQRLSAYKVTQGNFENATIEKFGKTIPITGDVNYELVLTDIDGNPLAKQACEIRHTADIVTMDDKPTTALRSGRNSSMRLAINAVKNGEALAVVSAGNTGALMAMATIVLKTLPGINRPAIVTSFPTQKDDCVMLDLGANIECDAENCN